MISASPSPTRVDSLRASATTLRRLVALLITVALLGFIAPSSILADDDDDGRGKRRVETIYVQSNNPLPGRNAIYAYRHDEDGCLRQVGTYLTGGTGAFNPTDRLGTDDHDQEIITTPDRKFLFTVNQGSNSIAVFRIKPDGDLTPIKGSPFPSGGNGPVSLGLRGNTLYVVNQNENTPEPSTSGNPNYTAFRVAPNGRLTPIPNSTINLPLGSTPTQALISPDGRHLFGIELFGSAPYTPQLAPFLPPRSSLLDSFNITSGGLLQTAAGTPQPLPIEAMFAIPEARYALGLQAHPTENILYVGFLLGFKLGVYTYDASGQLTFVTAAPLPGDAGICWIVINKDRTRAYASNAITNTISVINIENPLAPFHIQSVFLKLEDDAPTGPFGPVNFATTPFQIALDSDSETLYVKNHETTPEGYADGNALHFLDVQPDGTLIENPCSPEIIRGIPANAHPSGVLVMEQRSNRGDD